MASNGYFVITDVTGYTEYLTGSELDHANDILQSLFDAQIRAIQHPFVLSGFRGDAIFMYVPVTSFVQPQSFIEALENFYIVFADTLQQMQYNTTCTCRACTNMSMLDLKMCIHYGQYIIQKLGDREELLGPDVIVPHRMLKNNVIEATGIHSYALFTDASAQQLDLSEYCEGLIQHAETYEHLGEVVMWVHDLHKAWESEQVRRRKFVRAEEAWVRYEGELPYPPALVWEYLTDPGLEAAFLGYDFAARTDELGGRVREDSQFHCSHGDTDVHGRVVDWKPFDYYTLAEKVNSFEFMQTRRLIPTTAGSRLCVYITRPSPDPGPDMRKSVQAEYERGFGNLAEFIRRDVEKGSVTVIRALEGVEAQLPERGTGRSK